MSLDPSGSIKIDRKDFWSTPIWHTNLQTNTRKERQVSFNEDLLTYIQGQYEKNPNTKEKSNRYGGWQTNTDFYNEAVVEPLKADIWNICKTIWPQIKGMYFTQMWAAINFKGSYNILHCHGSHYSMSGAYYLQVPENSGRIAFRDPRPAATNHYWSVNHITGGEYAWYQPIESDLYLFPPFLDHTVEPSLSDQPRVMISFDLRFAV